MTVSVEGIAQKIEQNRQSNGHRGFTLNDVYDAFFEALPVVIRNLEPETTYKAFRARIIEHLREQYENKEVSADRIAMECLRDLAVILGVDTR